MIKEEPIWFPSENYIAGSHLQTLIHRLGLNNYDELYDFSVLHTDKFWQAALDALGIEWFTPYHKFVDLAAGPQWPRWFVGGQINLVHNALTRQLKLGRGDQTAIVWESESGSSRSLTYRELDEQTACAANGLIELGFRRGDAVGLFVPMIVEAAVFFLAVIRLGGIVVPIFSGYGAEAVATRLQDAKVRYLLTADGIERRGKVLPMKSVANEAVSKCSTIERVIMVEHLHNVPGAELTDKDITWSDLTEGKETSAPIEAMDANDPFMIIYTSGTTGKPKGAVHTQGGFPLKTIQDMAHVFDLRAKETLLWLTDLGWMVGPAVIIGGLTLGATTVFYSGAPDYPEPDQIWNIVEQNKVTHLGLAPTLIRSLRAFGEEPMNRHNLDSLRVLISTGEAWDLESYVWYSRKVGKGKLPILNYSGGTEVSGGILGCVTHRPIKATGFNTAVPGIQAAVLNDAGQLVQDQVGELSVLRPFVGMTNGFWNDQTRYLESYWSRFDQVWVHGDWAFQNDDNHWFLFGRSDDVIKIAGKRVGPTEIEAAAGQHPAVVQAAAVGVPHPVKGEEVVLFVIAHPSFTPNEQLAEAVKEEVTRTLGKSLKPSHVYFVKDLPRTRNGKVMRRVIRTVYQGQQTGDLSALENPDVIGMIQNLHKTRD
ncbi:AMP-binding protein [Paenibacillus validus]|nr:AMP-binding protein [Paenibacillus validus]